MRWELSSVICQIMFVNNPFESYTAFVKSNFLEMVYNLVAVEQYLAVFCDLLTVIKCVGEM